MDTSTSLSTPASNGRLLGAEWAPRVLGVLRIITALLFMQHGCQKLLGFPVPLNGPVHMYDAFTLLWFAGVLELVGGAFVLVGLFTRPVAFVLSGEMAVGYFMAHFPSSPFPAVNGGDAAVLYCFVFLYISAAGAGAWSLDRLLVRRA